MYDILLDDKKGEAASIVETHSLIGRFNKFMRAVSIESGSIFNVKEVAADDLIQYLYLCLKEESISKERLEKLIDLFTAKSLGKDEFSYMATTMVTVLQYYKSMKYPSIERKTEQVGSLSLEDIQKELGRQDSESGEMYTIKFKDEKIKFSRAIKDRFLKELMGKQPITVDDVQLAVFKASSHTPKVDDAKEIKQITISEIIAGLSKAMKIQNDQFPAAACSRYDLNQCVSLRKCLLTFYSKEVDAETQASLRLLIHQINKQMQKLNEDDVQQSSFLATAFKDYRDSMLAVTELKDSKLLTTNPVVEKATAALKIKFVLSTEPQVVIDALMSIVDVLDLKDLPEDPDKKFFRAQQKKLQAQMTLRAELDIAMYETKKTAEKLFSSFLSLSSDDFSFLSKFQPQSVSSSQYHEKASEAKLLGLDINILDYFFSEIEKFLKQYEEYKGIVSIIKDPSVILDNYIVGLFQEISTEKLENINQKLKIAASCISESVEGSELTTENQKQKEMIIKMQSVVATVLSHREDRQDKKEDKTHTSYYSTRMQASAHDKALIAYYLKIHEYLKTGNVEGLILTLKQLNEYLKANPIKGTFNVDGFRIKYNLDPMLDKHKLIPVLSKHKKFSVRADIFFPPGIKTGEDNKNKAEVKSRGEQYEAWLSDLDTELRAFQEALNDLRKYGLTLKEPDAKARVATLVRELQEASHQFLIGETNVNEFKSKAESLFRNAYPYIHFPRTWSGNERSGIVGRVFTSLCALIKYYLTTHPEAKESFPMAWRYKVYRTKTGEKTASLEDAVIRLANKSTPRK